MELGRRILFPDECYDSESCSPSSAPPPPPPPGAVLRPAARSPPPVPSSPATPIQISNKNRFLMTQVVVVVICVLAVCLLLLASYAFYRYWSSSRRRRRRAAAALAAAWGPPRAPADAEGDFLREDLLTAGEEPYHVWYIRTAGLDQRAIGAITVCEYRKGEGLVEGSDCAVCLGEFGEGELLRLLPKCSHAFHVPCIDTWLRSHVNCPLCRAPVLAPPPARVPTPPLPSPPLPSLAIEGSNLVSAAAAAAAAQQSSRQATDGDESDGPGESLRRIAPEDGSEDGGNSAQAGFVVDPPAAGASFSSQESETWMSIDLGDGGLGDETAPEEGDADSEPQPVRRSVSMDSWAMASLLLRMRLAGSSRDGRRKPSAGEDDGSTGKKAANGENHRKGATLQDAPLEMARCMSDRRFSLSRFSRRGRDAILPL